jgi:hypothetical protein
MAVLATTNPTLIDLTKRLDPNGSIAQIAEVLNQTNAILDDIPWIEANDGAGHRSTIRTGLPAPTWRKLYGGVQPTKSDTAQVRDTTGMLEDYAEVDKALADLNGNTAAFRMSEDTPHIEGMSEEWTKTVLYGDETVNPERFTGLMPRFNNLSTANNKINIIDAGGTGSDNTSILLVLWGDQTVFGIYPKGSRAGLYSEDKGQVTIENVDGASGRMEAYRTWYKWDCGLVVRDWRYIVRICNIDLSDLNKASSGSSADLVDLLMRALAAVPDLNKGRPVFYANRTISSMFGRQAMGKVAYQLTYDDILGASGITRKAPMFMGIPIHRVDQLLNTESRVT